MWSYSAVYLASLFYFFNNDIEHNNDFLKDITFLFVTYSVAILNV